MNKCNYCINKEACELCDKGWKDKFIPNNDIWKFFNSVYVGVRGINGYVYTFNCDHPDLVPTHGIEIDGDIYCAYCGDKMQSVYETMDEYDFYGIHVGYCCFCDGAKKEIEYRTKKQELEQKYRKDLSDLDKEYRDKLVFCSDKLFEIKQNIEKRRFSNKCSNDYNYFSMINDEKIAKIEQIVR